MAAPAAVHPSEQTLQSYGLGKLDDMLSEAVAKHLAECDSCRVRVAELTSDTFLGRLQEAQARPASIPAVGSSLPGMSKLDGDSRTPSPPPASTMPPGLAEHPDYQILRELGRGGMGVVYLAENRMMGRKEVLKVVSSHLLNRKGVLERFLREIRSAAQLHHPNIVTAYSATKVGESIVFSMQYVEGYDLAKLVEKSGPLPVAHACNFVYQAALGLQHAHERGMVHRDIKPSNLMLARDGNKPVIKILDFGLAKVTSEGARRRRSDPRRPDARHAPLRRPRADASTHRRPTSGPTSTAWAARSTAFWPATRRSTPRVFTSCFRHTTRWTPSP